MPSASSLGRAAVVVMLVLAGCEEPPPSRSTSAPEPARDAGLSDDELVARFLAREDSVRPHEGAQPVPADGVAHIVWPDGVPAAEGTMRDGRREGLWRRYRRDGRRLEEGHYVADVPVGTWRAWDARGAEIAPTDHTGRECDGEGPIPLPYGLPCGLAVPDDDRSHHADALPLRRCIGRWRERLIRSLIEEERTGELSNAIRQAQSAEVLAVVRDEVERALDAVAEDVDALRDPRNSRPLHTGLRELADSGDFALRHRAVRDLDGPLGTHVFSVYGPVLELALRDRPGFDATWYRALQAQSERRERAELRYRLERAERGVFGAVASVDDRTGEALMRRALRSDRDDAGFVHQGLARLLVLRGDEVEAQHEWAAARALYTARRCDRCLVDLERTIGMVEMERQAGRFDRRLTAR